MSGDGPGNDIYVLFCFWLAWLECIGCTIVCQYYSIVHVIYEQQVEFV